MGAADSFKRTVGGKQKLIPQKIILHKKSKTLELGYQDNDFILPASYLRTKSPSIDNKTNPAPFNSHIAINTVNLLGNYAMQISFDDGHKTGIYSWEYLRRLCIEMKNEEVKKKAAARKTGVQTLHIQPAPSQKK